MSNTVRALLLSFLRRIGGTSPASPVVVAEYANAAEVPASLASCFEGMGDLDLDAELEAMAPEVLRDIALEQYTRALAALRQRAEARVDAQLRFGDLAVGILFEDGTLVGLGVEATEQMDLLDALEDLTDGADPTEVAVRVGALLLAPGRAFHVVLLVEDGDETVAVPVWADRIQVVATSH